MLSISVFIFISAVFITAYWWFGLTIIFGLATYGFLLEEIASR
jgi:hypothetical protein